MHITRDQSIVGLPIYQVRDLFRRMGNDGTWDEETIAEGLGMPRRKAHRVIVALVRDGWLEKAEPKRNVPVDEWEVTQLGVRLINATGRRPILRSTATRLLEGVVERCGVLASWRHQYAYVVGELRVFGSYLTDAQRLGDLDIAVAWLPRFTDNEQQHAFELERIRTVQRGGRRFGNIVSEYFWPQEEVRRFLKGGSRSVSLHDLIRERSIIDNVPSRLEYRKPGYILPAPKVAPARA